MATIPEITDRLTAATVKAEQASDIQYQVANGDANTDVPTDSGSTPTIKKWFDELGSSIEPQISGIPIRLNKAILSYPTYSAAIAAAASLPDGQRVQAIDTKSIYFANAGALIFVDFISSTVSIADYEDLLKYSGGAANVYITGNGSSYSKPEISGTFTKTNREGAITNYGTVFSLDNGDVYEREDIGYINASWFIGPGALQKSIDAAGEFGTVFIPENYTGNDLYVNRYNIQIIDHRKMGDVAQFGIWSIVSPSEGSNLFPLGNDLVLRCSGPADTYIEHLNATCTTTQNLVIGANNNVLISQVRIGSQARGTLRTTDSFSLSSYGGFWVNRDEPDEEYVGPENYTIVDGTHINITCAKSHTGTTYIEQCGSTLLASRDFWLVANNVKSEKSTTFNPPVNVRDLHGDLVFTWPSDLGGAFPRSAFAIAPIITGAFGPNLDLYHQHRLPVSRVVWRDSYSNVIASFNNAGQMQYLKGGVTIGGASITDGTAGSIQIGRSSFSTTVPASNTDAFVEWTESGSNSINPQGGAGNLVLCSSANGGSETILATQKSARLRVSQSGVGFNGKDPSKPTVSGSTGGNAALISLISSLESMGLIINSTT